MANKFKTIWLAPEDVVLFRDARPYAAGADHHAHSLYPAPPSTAYGAVRSAGIARYTDFATFTADGHEDEPWRQVYGTRLETRGLHLLGPLPWREQERDGQTVRTVFFPAPLDLAVPKKDPWKTEEDTRPPLARLIPLDGDGQAVAIRSSILPGLAPLWLKQPGFWESAAGFLDAGGLEDWLRGKVPKRCALHGRDALLLEEARTGIALDREHRTVEEGKLYTAGYLRSTVPGEPAAESGFVAVLEGCDAAPPPDDGWLRLGGDARPARYEVEAATGPPWPGSPANGDSRRFTLLLATPAVFHAGWTPASWKEDSKTWVMERHDGLRARLVAAAVRPGEPLGGWDLAANQGKGAPRSLRRTAAAGSVYFFERIEGDATSLHGTCISDDRPEQGFGLAFVGTW